VEQSCASKPKHQEISAELAKLRKQHYQALAKATFGGFTAPRKRRMRSA